MNVNVRWATGKGGEARREGAATVVAVWVVCVAVAVAVAVAAAADARGPPVRVDP